MAIIVGIDMSKNSPGVCIRDGNKLSFSSFIRSDEDDTNKRMSKGRKAMLDHYSSLRKSGVSIISNSRVATAKEYSDLEVWKIFDASQLAHTIVQNLPDNADFIGIEGFSYGSKGNAGLDIAGYAYCLRKELFEKYGQIKLCIFSPANVKKMAGKGNANKEAIMEYFITSTNKDLRETEFWKGIISGEIHKEKPVDDIIDAFYVQECALKLYNERI